MRQIDLHTPPKHTLYNIPNVVSVLIVQFPYHTSTYTFHQIDLLLMNLIDFRPMYIYICLYEKGKLYTDIHIY